MGESAARHPHLLVASRNASSAGPAAFRTNLIYRHSARSERMQLAKRSLSGANPSDACNAMLALALRRLLL
tara:strand:+ start:19270 stop:19482 length:213 start_codon:yes stop_codon:yes gene_type:complete